MGKGKLYGSNCQSVHGRLGATSISELIQKEDTFGTDTHYFTLNVLTFTMYSTTYSKGREFDMKSSMRWRAERRCDPSLAASGRVASAHQSPPHPNLAR